VTSHLVVIDMQNVFADPDSAWFTPRFAEVTGPLDRLISAFGARTTFTRFVAPADPDGAWVGYYEQWPFARQPPDAAIYKLVDHYGEHAGLTLDATTFGKWGPDLARRIQDADTLVVAGVSTECCVLSTVVAAADAGRRVVVAADACAGADDTSHAQALAVLAWFAPLVEISSTEQILSGSAAAGQR
jgi:nicotinamidase-related amidase